jgi:hypothetical protein
LIFRSKLTVQESEGAVRPVFDAIAEVQKNASVSDWYVTQPDHACISGKLAAALDSGKVPNVGEAIVRAISLHDVGWMPFDGDVNSPCAPVWHESGVPVSFANTGPERFLRAWMGSIQASQSTGALGGLIVSAHFVRIGHPYLERGAGTAEQRAQVEQFVQREKAREERLLPQAGLPPEQVEALIAVVQFCDLASLYFCANPAAPVELPQMLNGGRVQLSFEDGAFHMDPKLLDRALEFEIPCVRWVDGKAEREMVAVRVE